MEKPKIQVIIRKRPLTGREIKKQCRSIVDVISDQTLTIEAEKVKVDMSKYIEKFKFHFDEVFDENHDNLHIYKRILQPLVKSIFNKSKVTVFAYGQTGSGKTFTMMGNQKEIEGLYLLAARDLFTIKENPDYDFLKIGVSFYEIYCGKAYDLLNKR